MSKNNGNKQKSIPQEMINDARRSLKAKSLKNHDPSIYTEKNVKHKARQTFNEIQPGVQDLHNLIRIYYKELQAKADKYHNQDIVYDGNNVHAINAWLHKQMRMAEKYYHINTNNSKSKKN